MVFAPFCFPEVADRVGAPIGVPEHSVPYPGAECKTMKNGKIPKTEGDKKPGADHLVSARLLFYICEGEGTVHSSFILYLTCP